MKTLGTLSILGLFSLLSACETVPTTSPQQLEQVKAQGKARVVAPHSTFWAGFDIGTHFDLSIMAVDGVSQHDDEIEPPAGRHQIGVGCDYSKGVMAYGPGGVTEVTLDVDLQAGHLYQLKPITGNLDVCTGAIEDLTWSSALAGKDPHMQTQPRPVELHKRAQTKPVIDEWENLALYYSPPPNYEVIDVVAGEGGGFRASSRMNDVIEGLKKSASVMGATGVLVVVPDDIWGPQPVAQPPMGTGSPVYAADSNGPAYWDGSWVVGLAIYVPADLEAFQNATQVHATTCIALTQKKDDMKDAYKAAKKTGTSAEIAAAKQAQQAAEDAADAAFCGDDEWYAEQMAAQKH